MCRLSNVFCWVVLLTLLAGPGCRQLLKKQQEPVPANPLDDPNLVAPDYVSRAIAAAGGRRAWANTKKLELDCVVTFYQPDGGFYLTWQRHEVYPSKNSITISGREPAGPFRREFSGRKHAEFSATAPPASKLWFAPAILDIITAPVRLLDRSAAFTEAAGLVKIEGQWYKPIERTGRDEAHIWSQVLFYQNADSALVDILRLVDMDRNSFFLARGYDYRQLQEGAALVPAKIEIFQTDVHGAVLARLAKVDYHTFSFTP
jgi:hypothetical protein